MTMSKNRMILAVLAATLVSLAAASADAAEKVARPARPSPELNAARADAATQLLKQAAALNLVAGGTVAQALKLDSAAPLAATQELLDGVEEKSPAHFYGNYTCIVDWRLSYEQLQGNLNKIQAKGALPEMKLAGEPKGALEAQGKYQADSTEYSNPRAEKNANWPPSSLGGWSRIDGYERMGLEHAALDKAQKDLAQQVMAATLAPDVTVKSYLERNTDLAGKFGVFLNSLRPHFKAYYAAGGLVEIEMLVPAQKIADELTTLNAEMAAEKKLQPQVFTDFAKATKDFVARGYAAKSGKDEKPPAEQFTAFPISDIPAVKLETGK
jgi:hypothetical protein